MSIYIAGLDLGKEDSYTALTIAEVTPSIEHSDEMVIIVRHIERFRDVPYTKVAATVSQRLLRPPLYGNVELVVDATGPGIGTAHIFAALGYAFRGVIITGGHQENQPRDRYWTVPKNDLVSAALIPFSSDPQRLFFTGRNPHSETLKEELRSFRRKQRPSTGNEYFEHREGEHDDLVLSVSLACWAATRFNTGVVDETLSFSYGPDDMVDIEGEMRDTDFSRWILNR